jgi:hypothetical protein
MRAKRKGEFKIRTGDGNILTVDNGICDISEKLEAAVDEIYLENSSEASIQLVIEFYEIYSKFTETQKKKWDDPITFVEKIGKAKQSESDKRLVVHYNTYRQLQTKEFFELMKTAWDMRVLPLVKILSFIITVRILNKTTEDIDQMFSV